MPRVELVDRTLNDEPAPRFPSLAEIALAEQLRRRLELRYLGEAAEGVQEASVEDARRVA